MKVFYRIMSGLADAQQKLGDAEGQFTETHHGAAAKGNPASVAFNDPLNVKTFSIRGWLGIKKRGSPVSANC